MNGLARIALSLLGAAASSPPRRRRPRRPTATRCCSSTATSSPTHPLLYKKLPYSPTQDFEPVVPLFQNAFFVVVSAASPWKSMSDLVAAAKQKPGEMSYGSWFVGSPA